MEKVKVTKQQKKELKPLILDRDIADTAFRRASEMVYDRERKLWERIKEMWPDVTKIEYLDCEDWVVTICPKNDAGYDEKGKKKNY